MIEKYVNTRTRRFVKVLKSGAFDGARSVVLETHKQKYLFNCGEGTYRCLLDTKLKTEQWKIKDILITHKSWENLGGLYAMLFRRKLGDMLPPAIKLGSELGSTLKDVKSKINIHGPPDVENVLLEPYNLDQYDCDFTDVLTHTQKHEISDGSYSDSEFEIEYVKIPKSASLQTNTDKDSDVSVAYIVKPKPTAIIDNSKVNGLGIGENSKRKSASFGEKPNTIYNGRVIVGGETDNQPEPVPLVVVLECPNEDFLESMISSDKLNDLSEHKDSQPQLMIHMSPADVVDREEYRMFLDRFRTTDHLLLNKRSKHTSVSFYFHPCLNNLHPGIFPELPSYKTHAEPTKPSKNNVTQAETNLAYNLKPHQRNQPWFPWYRRLCLVLDKDKTIKNKYETDGHVAAEVWKKHLKRLPEKDGPKYPEVVFLGTGSFEPDINRNVSAILLHLSADKCMLLDCGEGTLDQLRTFYGGEETDNVLTKLQAIFVSHNHTDHYMGLCGVIKARQDALQGMSETGQSLSDTQLLLLCPALVEKWLDAQMRVIMPEFWFGGRSKYIEIINHTNSKKYEEPSILQKLDLMLLRLPKSYHIQHSRAISVHHLSGWKLVYTGDTRPCREIITKGMGCDLLIHEATFSDELKGRALSTCHSTMSEAIEVGREMGAKFTVLTHFSQRYETIPVFPKKMPENVAVAFDLMRVTLADLHVLARLIPTLEVVFKNSMNRSKRKEKIAIKKPATKFLDYEVLQNILHGGSSLELDVSSNEIMTTKKLAAETLDYDVLQNMLHGGSSSELDISSDEIMTTKKPASETADYDVLQNILHGGSSSELDECQDMIHDVDSEKKKKKKKSSVKVKSTASEASNDRKIESENPEKHMPEANTLQHVRDGEMIEETCTLGDKSDSDKKKKKKKKSQSVKVESTALEASDDRKIESENPEKHMPEANTLQHVRDGEMIKETCTLGDKSDSDKKKKRRRKSQVWVIK